MITWLPGEKLDVPDALAARIAKVLCSDPACLSTMGRKHCVHPEHEHRMVYGGAAPSLINLDDPVPRYQQPTTSTKEF